MSLTLDEVRRVRFRMARRSVGYEVSDVDLFIDKVESAFQQFEKERDVLRLEAEASAGAGGGDESVVAAKDEEIAQLREQVQRLEQNSAQNFQNRDDSGDHIATLERRNEELRGELERVRAELSEVRSQRIGEAANQTETIKVTTTEEASPMVTRLLQLATEQAEQLVNEAETEANRKVEEAKQHAREITTDAQTKAERIESEARVNAEQLRDDAQRNADQVNVDVDRRRHELFNELETERDELSHKVDHLRSFEQKYRDNLRDFLTRKIEVLDSQQPEPEDAPDLSDQPSRTPRLDALAGEPQD